MDVQGIRRGFDAVLHQAIDERFTGAIDFKMVVRNGVVVRFDADRRGESRRIGAREIGVIREDFVDM